MPNPFENSKSVFPDITQAVENAFEENAENGTIEDKLVPNIGDISKQDSPDEKYAGIGFIENKEIVKKFIDSFEESGKLFARIGLKPPTPDEFEQIGVDYFNLSEKYKKMKKDKLEPTLVICPALPTVDATGQSWKELFNWLSQDESLPDYFVNHGEKRNWLIIDPFTDKYKKEIFRQELELTKQKNYILQAGVGARGKDIVWSIALMPGCPDSEDKYSHHDKYETHGNFPSDSKLPTLSQYLTMQAISLQSQSNPIDYPNSSWISGTFVDDNHFVYSPTSRRAYDGISVGYKSSDSGTDSLGVRLPVWG